MELIQKKMEIAKRAGELNSEINGLQSTVEGIERKLSMGLPESLTIQIHIGNNTTHKLNSYEIEGKNGTELHLAILKYLEQQSNKRTKELDELIKILV